MTGSLGLGEVVALLRAIADDPNETPERKERARRALEDPGPPVRVPISPILATDIEPKHSSSGDRALHVQAVEEGWDE